MTARFNAAKNLQAELKNIARQQEELKVRAQRAERELTEALFPEQSTTLKSGTGEPLAAIRDTAVYALADRDLDFRNADLLPSTTFLRSLTTAGNLDKLWEQNLRALIADTNPLHSTDNIVGAALLIAENNDASGVAMTTVTTGLSKSGRVHDFHIVRNTLFNRTLVVGRKALPGDLKKAFAKARISYVNAAAKNAEAAVSEALTDIIPGNLNRRRLSEAFCYRNENVKDPQKPINTDKALEEILVSAETTPMYPKYIVKKSAFKKAP